MSHLTYSELILSSYWWTMLSQTYVKNVLSLKETLTLDSTGSLRAKSFNYLYLSSAKDQVICTANIFWLMQSLISSHTDQINYQLEHPCMLWLISFWDFGKCELGNPKADLESFLSTKFASGYHQQNSSIKPQTSIQMKKFQLLLGDEKSATNRWQNVQQRTQASRTNRSASEFPKPTTQSRGRSGSSSKHLSNFARSTRAREESSPRPSAAASVAAAAAGEEAAASEEEGLSRLRALFSAGSLGGGGGDGDGARSPPAAGAAAAAAAGGGRPSKRSSEAMAGVLVSSCFCLLEMS